MTRERCHCCGAILPPPKTCPTCQRTFYRSEGGRKDATYCRRKCADTARQRRHRQQKRDAGNTSGNSLPPDRHAD